MADNISFQVKLAEAVEKRPTLYNFHLKDYNNREKVQSAWESVGEEVNRSAEKCKETWRSMRVVFTRKIKKGPPGFGSRKNSWPPLQNMMFLKSYVNAKGNNLPRKLPSSLHESSEDDESSAVSETQAATHGEEQGREHEVLTPYSKETPTMGRPPLKKNKIIHSTSADDVEVDYIQSKTAASNENPRKLFLMSLLPDLDEMTATQFKTFRREVVNLIDGIGAPDSPKLEISQFCYQQLQSTSPISTYTRAEKSPAPSSSAANHQPTVSDTRSPHKRNLAGTICSRRVLPCVTCVTSAPEKQVDELTCHEN